MASYARNELGLKVHDVPFADVELEPEAFDAVTMWDYIEHSTDPLGDLRRAARVLRPGGLLLISTGDAGSVVARASGPRWHLLTPRHHNFFFTRDSLERALRTAGFSVRGTAYPSNLYSVYYLVHKLRTLADIAVLRQLSTRLGGMRVGALAIPVNLYDIMVVSGSRSDSDSPV